MSVISNYPDQRCSRTEKTKKEFYIPTMNYVISKCINNGLDASEVYNTVNGSISQVQYSKFLNPLNSTNEKYKNFPATLRNYDMISDVIRRYMGEFIKQNIDFTVYSSDPDIVDRFNITIQSEIMEIAMTTFDTLVNNPNGKDQEIPDFQQIYEEAKKKYVDEIAIKGQHALNALVDFTDSIYKYYKAFYDFITIGRAYSYRDIRGTKLYKEIVPSIQMYTQPDNYRPFIEDRDFVYRSFKVTIPELISDYSNVISNDKLLIIKDLYQKHCTTNGTSSMQVPLNYFTSLTGENITTLTNRIGNDKTVTWNTDGIPAIHMQWKTEVKIAYIKVQDPLTGVVTEKVEEVDSYTLKPELGEIDLEYDWINETWEQYRFFDEAFGVYSEPRPIAFQCRSLDNIKECKLSYNGVEELIPGTGFTFSIPNILSPFQISRNILYFAREKAIGRNKGNILVMPKSTLGSNEEETLYRMDAAGLYIYDDSDEDSMQKANSIKGIDVGLSDYIVKLTDIIDRMKVEGWDMVDMNPQRYGDINTSAGKGTTNEAIIRSSMGSVLIYTIFDKFVEKDYTTDLNYSKVIMANLELLSYRDSSGKQITIPFDSKSHILANYNVFVRNSAIERDKRRKAEDIAFAAAQNNNYGLAISAITESSTTALLNSITEFDKESRAMQERIANEKEQLNLQLQQLKSNDAELDRQSNYNIALLKETNANQRTIIEVEAKLSQLNGIEGDLSMPNEIMNDLKANLEQLKLNNDMLKHRDKMSLERDKMNSQEKIARMNKN